MNSQRHINTQVIALVLLSTVIQGMALLGLLPIAPGTLGRTLFSCVEMLLVLMLLLQGWRIKQWSQAIASSTSPPLSNTQSTLIQNVASLCFYSLLMCTLGDFVNRNYFAQYYQYDTVIKYSYLITSISFFFPGYLLILVANWSICRSQISARVMIQTTVVMLVVGILAFLSNYNPRVNTLSSLAIFGYTLLETILIGSCFWLIKQYGWAASRVVVIGILLAAIADALLGNFMIYRDYYPLIGHVNWIIYFASLAMIQQLPFLVAQRIIPTVGLSSEARLRSKITKPLPSSRRKLCSLSISACSKSLSSNVPVLGRPRNSSSTGSRTNSRGLLCDALTCTLTSCSTATRS